MAGFGKSEITVDRTIGKFRQKNLNKKVKLKKFAELDFNIYFCANQQKYEENVVYPTR